MRIFTAAMVHESSSFSPIPTGMESFREILMHRPSRGESVPARFDAIECILTKKCIEREHDVVESVTLAATPSGPIATADYVAFRDEIVADLKRAMPVDAIALFLHGAQLAQDYDDCEGDLLSALRSVAGPDVPIGVEFDLHGNVTSSMIENATAIVACKEYPHTDFSECADELLDILEAAVMCHAKPVSAWRRLPMLGIFHTTRQPLRGLIDRIRQLERAKGVLSISIAHGFPWANTVHASSSIVVITDNDIKLAGHLCDRIASEFFGMREEIAAPMTTIDAALEKFDNSCNGLTVIADTADNAGGGASSDSTHFLHELSRRKIEHAAIGMVWDPVAVDLAFAAGAGTVLPMRIGGKIGPLSGDPFDAEVKVTAVAPNLHQIAFGRRQSLGKAAALRTIDGLDIIITSAREQVHSPECFTEMGIDLRAKRLVVVKSAQHFRDKFGPLAKTIIYAVARGSTSVDFKTFDYKWLRRPIWPLDPGTTIDL